MKRVTFFRESLGDPEDLGLNARDLLNSSLNLVGELENVAVGGVDDDVDLLGHGWSGLLSLLLD